MKKKVYTALLLSFMMIGWLATSNTPAKAQENLDSVLARAAAKSFLVTLTRPELAEALDFYTVEALRVEGILSELGEVADYQIDNAAWLVPDKTYQVEATLQPGNRDIIIRTGKYDNRWQVDGIELPGDSGAAPAAVASSSTPGLQPVEGNGSGKLVFQTQSGGGIYVIDADGTGLNRVTHGLDPELSPDGSQIVFTRWDPRYELFTINVDGTNERAWFSGKRQMKSPSWSADGRNLVFSYQDGGRLEGDLKRYDLEDLGRDAALGKNPVRVPDYARGVKVEGGVLEFFIPPDAYWWLALIDTEQEEYRDLSTGVQYNYAPSWHPTDPNQLIFRGDKGIALYDDASQTSQPVSIDDRDRGAVAVSPDGSKVAFTYYQDGHWEIHTINIDGTNRQRLTETPLAVLANRNKDNNEVYINEEGFRTMSRAQPEGMPNLNWNNAAPTWSPDGSQIAFMSDRSGEWDIWIMNADGSNQRRMFPNGAVDDLTFDFAGVDERMLSWQ